MPAKGDTVEIFYGINRNTLIVESVSLTNDGTMYKSLPDGQIVSRELAPGRSAKAEMTIVFNLLDVVSFPPALDDTPNAKRVRAELEAKAAAMKSKSD